MTKSDLSRPRFRPSGPPLVSPGRCAALDGCGASPLAGRGPDGTAVSVQGPTRSPASVAPTATGRGGAEQHPRSYRTLTLLCVGIIFPSSPKEAIMEARRKSLTGKMRQISKTSRSELLLLKAEKP